MTRGAADPRPSVLSELPTSLYIESTNRCDSKCRTCIRTHRTLEPPKDLTLEELKKIVTEFPRLERVVLHGIGEPLLNKEIFSMVEYLKTRGATVLFNSDAISLTPPRARRLIASGLDELRVSMDAAAPETYRKIRGVPQFDRVVRNLTEFVSVQRELRANTPKLSLWFVGTRTNIVELPEFVRLAAKIGAREVYFQRLVYNGLGLAVEGQSLQGATDEVEAIIEEARAIAIEHEIVMNASGLKAPSDSLKPEEKERPWSGCRRPWNLMYVTANGHVLPCCVSPWTARDYPGLILGHAFKESLREIWNGERYRAFRTQFKSDTPPDPCRGCGSRWSL